MDFSINREQRELLARLDEFCRQNLHESEIQQWTLEGAVPDSFMLKYYQEGFGRIGLPSRMGGITCPVITRVLVLERLAQHAGATLPVQGLMTYMHLVSRVASESQVELLRGITEETGKMPFSLAATEPQSGSKTFDTRTVATKVSGGFIINGAKSFISAGQYAPYVVLVANDQELAGESAGQQPLTFFLVSRDSPGVDTFPMAKVGQHLVPTADILFDGVFVTDDAVMGERGNASAELLGSFDYGRLFVCATSVGLAEAAFNQAVGFAMERNISGSPLIDLHAIQDMVTDMQMKVETMRSLLYKTACDLDYRSSDARLNTALLKRYVPKTAMEVADAAMQVMGGLGYRATNRAARIWKECRGNRFVMGTDEVMTVIASKRIARRMREELQEPPTWRF